MGYSVRHITRFCYAPVVRESVMEVRMQPRTDARQRCLSFSLDVSPRANTMVYRDFFGNAVHHFDIPGQHELIEVAAQAIVEVLPPPVARASEAGNWEELDERVAQGDIAEIEAVARGAALSRLRAGIDSMNFCSSGPLPPRDELHDRS